MRNKSDFPSYGPGNWKLNPYHHGVFAGVVQWVYCHGWRCSSDILNYARSRLRGQLWKLLELVVRLA